MFGELRNSAEENFGKLEKDGVGVVRGSHKALQKCDERVCFL